MKRLIGLLLCLGLLALPAAAQATPPETTLYGPNWGDDDTKLELVFTVDPEAGFECQVDEAPWYDCEEDAYFYFDNKWHVVFELAPETTFGHWFRVRGVNEDGPDPTPVSYYRE